MDWSRFCEEVGLTHEIASQIRLAITKLGSHEKLKPIKDELPENVTLPPCMIRLLLLISNRSVASTNNCFLCTAKLDISSSKAFPRPNLPGKMQHDTCR